MLNTKQQEFCYRFQKVWQTQLTVDELKEANEKFGCKYAPQWLIKNKDYKVGKSLFKLPIMVRTANKICSKKKLHKQTEN